MLVLKHLHQVLTLARGPVPRRGAAMSDLGIVEDGSIIVKGDRIAWVGPSRDLPLDTSGGETRLIDASGWDLIAMPGFVDSHTHPVFSRTRADEYEARAMGKTYQEIAAEGGGILSSVRDLRKTPLERLIELAERRFRIFLDHGTTTIEAKSGYGLSVEDEIKSLRALACLRGSNPLEAVPTFLGAHALPSEYAGRREEYVDLIIGEMIPRVVGERLALFCDVFCDEGYFSPDESRRILSAAKGAGLGLRIHAEELAHTGGARVAAELGAHSADHLEWIDAGDIEGLRAAGTVATLLPGTAFNLGLTRYPPARRLIDGGVTVALASDFNPGSCFTPNMQIILSIACSQMKMTPAEALCAATLNGAYSLGIADRVGSLEKGKQADIVLMEGSDFRELPYFFGVNHCRAVIKKGNIVTSRLEEM